MRAALEAHHAKAFEPWERGEITLDEYLDAVVFYEPRSFSHEEFFAAMCEQSKLLARRSDVHPEGTRGIR